VILESNRSDQAAGRISGVETNYSADAVTDINNVLRGDFVGKTLAADVNMASMSVEQREEHADSDFSIAEQLIRFRGYKEHGHQHWIESTATI
jgi:hypothetical protein